MKATLLAMLAVVGLTWTAGATEHDDARVEYVPGEHPEHGQFDERARSAEGRQLREKALAKRAAYVTALALLPDIADLDARVASAQVRQDELSAERKVVAEERSAACAVQRDAWFDARDALLALRDAADADPKALAAAEAKADAAQRAFHDAMAAIPEVQDLDHALAAARAELSELHIQRRAAEEAHAAHLAPELQAMKDAEAAYLQYVYGQ